jgi:myo-inositol 2-dehydrogenase / D-chiro-inositol 1-dehydrogenase
MRGDSDGVAVGVVGAGAMGTRHADNLHRKVVGVRVAGVTDANPARAEAVAAKCGSAKVFEDARSLIEDGGIEAVLIASPDDTHAGLVLECLRSSKPVLCEKPLATGSEDARKIVEAEAQLGKKLVQIGFMRRYDPQHVAVKEVVDAGAIGRPLLFEGWHRNVALPPFMSVEDVTTEFVTFAAAIHDFDSVRWLLGQEIQEVYARGVNTDPAFGADTYDLQLIQLSLSGGCLATIEVYVTADYGYEVGLELVGERGTARTASPQSPVVRRDGAQSQAIEQDFPERFQTAYLIEVEQWIEGIKNGRLIGPDVWDGYTSVLAAEGCVASLRSGMPQRLPSLERPPLAEV